MVENPNGIPSAETRRGGNSARDDCLEAACARTDVSGRDLRRRLLLTAVSLGLAWFCPPSPGSPTDPAPLPACLVCHPGSDRNHASGHAFGARDCSPCHGGDPAAASQEAAHRGLVPFPGNLDNAARTCGTCHPAQLEGVTTGPMATLTGMITATRQAFRGSWGQTESFAHPDPQAGSGPDGAAGATPFSSRTPPASPPAPDAGARQTGDGPATVSDLGDAPADSLLRKLCVSCHLGQPKVRHAHDPIRDRGGGCLACHVNDYPTGAHPEVSARVRDERCFGCHSRSARISLAYTGFAEVDEGALERPVGGGSLGRLPDGRLLERMAPDSHHRAGLACIDCHTGAEVMSLRYEKRGIACEHCHGPGNGDILVFAPPIQVANPASLVASPSARGAAENQNVPISLAQIEVRGEEVFLHRKLAGGEVRVPPYRTVDHPLAQQHERLTCEACHSQWAPRCYGCHLRYDPDGQQWDHLVRRVTPGRWIERRSDTRNGPPDVALRDDGRLGPVVPGMIMTVEHPDWQEPLVRTDFAAISPHTTGRARPCDSCHAASQP